MRRNNFSLTAASIFCIVAAVIFSAADASAQRNRNRYTRQNVASTIATLEQSSNAFRRDFDRFLDQSNINGTREEDRLNNIVRNYEQSLNRLRQNFDRTDTWWNTRSNVQDVMQNARPVNQMMAALPFARQIERQWSQMRRDINRLADTYELPNLGNAGGIGGGGQLPIPGQGNAPTWAVGTFYGRNPIDGGTITLTIGRNGSVTANFGGSINYGTLNGSNLNMNGQHATVTRISNGIRTRNPNTREVIDYYRTGGGGGAGTIGGNVPTWAVGTFYGRNPRTGGRITMRIQRNGEVYVSFQEGGGAYGTVYGSTLTVNGETATLRQNRNGIITTSNDSRERIVYTRQ